MFVEVIELGGGFMDYIYVSSVIKNEVEKLVCLYCKHFYISFLSADFGRGLKDNKSVDVYCRCYSCGADSKLNFDVMMK